MILPTFIRHTVSSLRDVLAHRTATTSFVVKISQSACASEPSQARPLCTSKNQEPVILRSLPESLQRRSSPPFNHYGFTLIELMIAMAILGILVTIGLPYYGEYKDRSTVGDAYSLMKEIRMQVSEQYIWDKALPDAIVDYSDLIPPNSDVSELYYDGSDSNSQIVAKFGTQANSTLQNRMLWLELDTSEPGKLTWVCKTPADATAKIPDNALPSLCR